MSEGESPTLRERFDIVLGKHVMSVQNASALLDDLERAAQELVVPSPQPADEHEHIRESAEKDPPFATAYLNAQARSTVCGLLALIDSTGAVDWQKIPNGTDNVWLRKARAIDRDADPAAAVSSLTPNETDQTP